MNKITINKFILFTDYQVYKITHDAMKQSSFIDQNSFIVMQIPYKSQYLS